MFRRREDENPLNEGETGSAQGNLLGGGIADSATVLGASSQSGSTYGGSASSSASTYPMGGAAPRASEPSQPAARPQPAASNPFRPAPPQQPEAPRGRGMEPKAPAAPFGGPATGIGGGKDSRRILTVGSDILLKGEIATCDRLVIEGKVDAVLNDVGTVELAESGSFKGVAQVENAEISGLFEGELVVKSRLVIYATGRVRGKITYGEIEIERGGELTGDIKTIASAGQNRSPRNEKSKEDKVGAAA